MTIPTTDSTAFAGAQRELERQLDERLAVLEELSPFALPSIDPVAFQTAAPADRRGHLRTLHAVRRADRAGAARGAPVRGRLHRMSEPC